MRWSLGEYAAAVDAALTTLAAQEIVERIWDRDHTVWREDPEEIVDRLAWLEAPWSSAERLQAIDDFVAAVREEGLDQGRLLGMGGSSLAPEVFRAVFGVAPGHVDLRILDSTDPWAVRRARHDLDLERALFVVSSKSGTTTETLSFFRAFHRWTAEAIDEPERRFVAVTDPGSPLERLAHGHGFRAVFGADPEVGGRYSALIDFGLVPGGLIGADLAGLLASAREMAETCRARGEDVPGNPGARLGAMLGTLAVAGRDKLTLVPSPALASLGAWIEQLVAESTGKAGRGILPVVGEPAIDPAAYGGDRVFVGLSMAGEPLDEEWFEALSAAGHPVARIELDDRLQLGGEMFRWEFATAVAGHFLGINPFDQPNVEAAKHAARAKVEEYRREGRLADPEPTLAADGVTVYAAFDAASLDAAVTGFLAQGKPGDYVAIQAFLPPSGEMAQGLDGLRRAILDRTRLATTVGFGPRFLHSTGQLHKGDAGNGLFLQLTADPAEKIEIPDDDGGASSLTFGILEAAQAQGDRQALLDAGRRVLRCHLGDAPASGVERLCVAVEVPNRDRS